MEIAWAAGFIDGEGSFGIQKQKGRKPLPYLQACQNDRRVLDRLQAAIGKGKVYGPYKRKKEGENPYFYYRLTGAVGVEEAAQLLIPFLSEIKREQYRRCLKILEGEPGTGAGTSLEN